MVKDRIVVFNRLVDKEIADCSVFEELLENHYHKFVYFYSIIESDDLIEYIEDVILRSSRRSIRHISHIMWRC